MEDNKWYWVVRIAWKERGRRVETQREIFPEFGVDPITAIGRCMEWSNCPPRTEWVYASVEKVNIT